jgi:predicted dehydrogenase
VAGHPVLALIGGGRWARVYLSVLAAMPLEFPIVVVARHGADQLVRLRDQAGRAVIVVPDVDNLLSSTRPAGAIVVNAANSHLPTALRLLEARVPVLVEKPPAMDVSGAASLAQAARRRHVALLPALTYLHCTYLHNFADVVRSAGVAPSTLKLEWADPAAEARYGEQKLYDRGIGLAMDVVPHVWAILASVLGDRPVALESCSMTRGGRCVRLALRVGNVACDVVLEREAAERRRFLSLDDRISIDFTTEPGVIAAAGHRTSGDAQWSTRADRPVRRQVAVFLRELAAPPSERALADLNACTRLASACDQLVKEQQNRLLARSPTGRFDADTECAISELLAPRLLGSGRIRPGDRAALQDQVQALRSRVAQEPAGDWLQALASAHV